VGGRGGVLVPQVVTSGPPVPLSRLFGGGLESHKTLLKSVGTASGWCGVGHRHVPAKCARGYPRKRPGSTPNPKSGSEMGVVKASMPAPCHACTLPCPHSAVHTSPAAGAYQQLPIDVSRADVLSIALYRGEPCCRYISNNSLSR
jgi:hypothetical protein